MAYKEVAEESSEFMKFEKIGDFVEGVFANESEGTYGLNLNLTGCSGKQNGVAFKDQGRTITVKGHLKRFPDLLKLEGGDKVKIGFAKTKDTGQESPMKMFKVYVDPAERSEREPGSDDADPFAGTQEPAF